ncbi:hypothetical protein GCM10027592_28990 [Spirosoma flavus]
MEDKNTPWKHFERTAIVIGALTGIIGAIGLFIQLQSKTTQVEYQIISQDYLTSSNNIPGLKANYEYSDIPVKNLWLIRFKLVNTGDETITHAGSNQNLIDSSIVFEFSKSIQILDKISLQQNNFPDHKLIRIDSNKLSLSFKQWRKNEFGLYSMYIKSNQKDVQLIPKTERVLKDGDIKVVDLTENQNKNKVNQSMLDYIIANPLNGMLRFMGIGFASILFILTTLYVFVGELFPYVVYLFWRWRYYDRYIDFVDSENVEDYLNGIPREVYLIDTRVIKRNPRLLRSQTKFWNNFKGKKPPELGSINSLYEVVKVLGVFFLISIICLPIILGLWIL